MEKIILWGLAGGICLMLCNYLFFLKFFLWRKIFSYNRILAAILFFIFFCFVFFFFVRVFPRLLNVSNILLKEGDPDTLWFNILALFQGASIIWFVIVPVLKKDKMKGSL